MNYLNEYHKKTVERKIKKMEQWKKSPIGCAEAIRQAQLNVTGTNFRDADGDIYVIDAEFIVMSNVASNAKEFV